MLLEINNWEHDSYHFNLYVDIVDLLQVDLIALYNNLFVLVTTS